ncbi:MAG: hypothetical protein ACJ8AC_08670, partial [Gemmatimonadaceae bacterium]
ALSLLTLIACQSSTDPGQPRVIGTIDAGGTLQGVIEVPAMVSRNESFTVTVSTFGNSCISAAGAGVVIDGPVATITPYDNILVGRTCLDYLKAYPRPVQLRFSEPGTATIRVTGRGSDGPALVTVERFIVVSQ